MAGRGNRLCLCIWSNAIARAVLGYRDSLWSLDADLAIRLRQGSYEFSLTLAALLAGMAIVGKVPGVWSSVALAVEAELLYLARVRCPGGVRARLRTHGCVRLLTGTIGLRSRDSSLPAIHSVRSCHVELDSAGALPRLPVLCKSRVEATERNRQFDGSGADRGRSCRRDARALRAGAAWLLFALTLLELGLRKRVPEFRVQAYALAAGGAAISAYVHVAHHAQISWIGLAVALAAAYGARLRSARRTGGCRARRLSDWRKRGHGGVGGDPDLEYSPGGIRGDGLDRVGAGSV